MQTLARVGGQLGLHIRWQPVSEVEFHMSATFNR